jgi:hypothetical protein
MMGDRGKISIGLAIFVILVTFPFWGRMIASGDAQVSRPELETPAGETACVEATEYMTANHMDLLNNWRDSVVREGVLDYTAEDGQVYQMSLTKTCLDCHDNRDDFCTRCHDYANVAPTCWECHTTPGGGS